MSYVLSRMIMGILCAMIRTAPVFMDSHKAALSSGVASGMKENGGSGDILSGIRHLLGEEMSCITLLTEEKDGEYRRAMLREDRLDLLVVKPFVETHYIYTFETEKITKNGQEIPTMDLDLFVKQLDVLFSAYNKGHVTFYSEKKGNLDSES